MIKYNFFHARIIFYEVKNAKPKSAEKKKHVAAKRRDTAFYADISPVHGERA
jgi:hypothetical protein